MHHDADIQHGIHNVHSVPLRSLLFSAFIFGGLLLFPASEQTQTACSTVYCKFRW